MIMKSNKALIMVICLLLAPLSLLAQNNKIKKLEVVKGESVKDTVILNMFRNQILPHNDCDKNDLKSYFTLVIHATENDARIESISIGGKTEDCRKRLINESNRLFKENEGELVRLLQNQNLLNQDLRMSFASNNDNSGWTPIIFNDSERIRSLGE